MGNLHSTNQQITTMKQDIALLFPQADADKDGLLNQQEFTTFLSWFLPLWTLKLPASDRIKDILTAHDKDNDGKLSRADIELMILPDGHEAIPYNATDPSMLQHPANVNVYEKMDCLFGLPSSVLNNNQFGQVPQNIQPNIFQELINQQAEKFSLMKDDINSIFPQSDIDKDGLLNQQEFAIFLEAFLPIWYSTVPSNDKIKSIFTTYDKDNDGKLSKADIEAMVLPNGYENVGNSSNNSNGVQSIVYNNIFSKIDEVFGAPFMNSQSQNTNPFAGLGASSYNINQNPTYDNQVQNITAQYTQAYQTYMENLGAAPLPNAQSQQIETSFYKNVEPAYNAMEAAMNIVEDDRAQTKFNNADLDKDGFINLQELELLMNTTALLHGVPKYTDDQIQSQMSTYDQDGDSKLSFNEFREMVRRGATFFLTPPV